MRRFLPMLFILLFFEHSANCQVENDTLNELNSFYSKNLDKLRELYEQRRGLSSTDCSYFDTREGIGRILSSYHEPIGILIYNYASDTLRVWLCKGGDNGNTIYFNKQLVVRAALVEAETQLRSALKVDLLTASRGVTKRGVTIREPVGKKRPSIESSIERATSILLPVSIRAGLSNLSHLLIVPEFNIGQFPFYVLRPFNNTSYLIDSMSVSMVPHLCNFDVLISNFESNGGGTFPGGRPVAMKFENPLVVGNPAYTNKSNYNLPPLPGSEVEANAIAKMLNDKALTGKAATISTVIDRAEMADLLYFATHGYFDYEKLLDSSFLAFAPGKDNTTGLWTARNIQQMKLKNRGILAVLSACQTGVGKVYDAGFIGLGRAFFIAGVDHTIMSLWSVNDEATKILMTSFMKNVLTKEIGFYPAGHLREAILAFKKENRDPALWAPFMLYGFPY